MTPQNILEEINDMFSEYLEMMTPEEKLIVIKNALAQKLAYEMTMHEHYKICFEKAILSPNWRINS
jgi:hypothetical protein